MITDKQHDEKVVEFANSNKFGLEMQLNQLSQISNMRLAGRPNQINQISEIEDINQYQVSDAHDDLPILKNSYN